MATATSDAPPLKPSTSVPPHIDGAASSAPSSLLRQPPTRQHEVQVEFRNAVQGLLASLDAPRVMRTVMGSPQLSSCVTGALVAIAYIAVATYVLERLLRNMAAASELWFIVFKVPLMLWMTLAKIAMILYGIDLYPTLYQQTERARGREPAAVKMQAGDGIVLTVVEIALMIAVDLVPVVTPVSLLRHLLSTAVGILFTPGFFLHTAIVSLISLVAGTAFWLMIATVDAINYSLNCFHFRLQVQDDRSFSQTMERFELQTAYFIGYGIPMLVVKYSLAYHFSSVPSWFAALAFNVVFAYNVMTSVTAPYGNKNALIYRDPVTKHVRAYGLQLPIASKCCKWIDRGIKAYTQWGSHNHVAAAAVGTAASGSTVPTAMSPPPPAMSKSGIATVD